MTIQAIVHPAEEGGYWAEIPALPGCFSEGDTMEELQENLQEAVHGWVEAANEKALKSMDANSSTVAIAA